MGMIEITPSPESSTPPPSPHRRRWLQYRLRSLFMVTTVVCIGMMWYVPIKKRADRQRAVVEQIRRDGGWVFYDDEFDASGKQVPKANRLGGWLRWLLGDDFFATVTNAHVANVAILGRLSDLTELLHLDLQGSNVSDRDLAQLSGLRQLNILILDKTAITNAGIKQLACLTDLKHLSLGHTAITDAGLTQLKELKQLKLLGLDSTSVTDVGLRQLADMSQLECLVLNNTGITDAGLGHLRGLKQLKQLCLDSTAVTSVGLVKLRGLPNLKTVFAHKTGVGAAQLNELKSLRNLEWFCLTGDYFRAEDFAELQRALPKCKIQFDGF